MGSLQLVDNGRDSLGSRMKRHSRIVVEQKAINQLANDRRAFKMLDQLPSCLSAIRKITRNGLRGRLDRVRPS
jgi:hypothetical protein